MKKTRKHLVIGGALMALVAIAATVPVGSILVPMLADTNGVVLIPGNIWVANSNAIKAVVPQGTVRSVGATSLLSGITVSGGPVTDQGELSLTGVLGLASGGTGGTNQASARAGIGLNSGNSSNYWRGDGTLAELPGLLPSLSVGNGGRVLTNAQGEEVVAPPPGISPPFTVYRRGSQYWTSVRMSDYKDGARSTTRYLSASGDDANDGLSWASPKASLSNVVSGVADSLLIYCSPGTYIGYGVTNSVSFSHPISLICTGGVAEFGRFVLSQSSGYFENCMFQGPGGHAFNWANTNSGNTLGLQSCVFRDSLNNGLYVQADIGFVYTRDCSASTNRLDGFNYHGYSASGTGSSLCVLEERSNGSWNGYSGSDANNGSTAHDGISIVRIGGTYFKNEGRNVHDIGDGTSWNINCRAGGSRASTAGSDVAFCCAVGAEPTVMYLQGCDALFGSPLTYLLGTNGTLSVIPAGGINDGKITVTTDITTSGYVWATNGMVAYGPINSQATTDQTGSNTGALRSNGGASVTKSLYVGTYATEQSLVLRGTNQLVAPTGLSVMGAQLWTDGTNLSTVTQGSSGSRNTNRVVLADFSSGLISTGALSGILSSLSVGNGGGVLTNTALPQTYWVTNQNATTDWTIPTWGRLLQIYIVAQGGPGASGRRGAAGTVRSGGGGGGGGGVAVYSCNVSNLWTNLLKIVIPAIRLGGPAVTTDDSNGTNGTSQNYTKVFVGSVSYDTNLIVQALGGNTGIGGDSDGSAGGSGGTVIYLGAAGGASSATGAGGSVGASVISGLLGGAGGGAGGGITSGDVPSAGGMGGIQYGNFRTAVGAPGGDPGLNGNSWTNIWPDNIATGIFCPWPGASGGGGQTNAPAGNGADGYGWGSGGGGGGASLNGYLSGKGGNGGPSAVVITVYCAFPAIAAPEWIGAAVQWTMDAVSFIRHVGIPLIELSKEQVNQ